MGVLNALLSLVSLVIAIFCFVRYGQLGTTMYIVGTAVFGLLMVIFGVMFLSGRVNKTEDIHITE